MKNSAKSGWSVARQVVAEEAEALHQLAATINESFDAVLDRILVGHYVVVSGLGKSGNIAAKIAASLTSTGTPATFMHPVEALHGDLGIVNDRHSLIALSRSGNTEEVVRFVEHFRRLGGPVIAVTQGRESRLAELAQYTILLPDLPEAGPLNLAPTTSCIMMLAVGDAIAMGLLERRGFQKENFAQYHPEGSLGKRLLLRAEDLMHAGDDLPIVSAADPFMRLVLEMSSKQLGLALIVDRAGSLLGTFTDGDLRRIFERVEDPRSMDAEAAYARSRRSASAPPVPISTIRPEAPAVECLRIMREAQITCLVVTDNARNPIGLIRLMDLVRAGL